jgi:hypothetical protein
MTAHVIADIKVTDDGRVPAYQPNRPGVHHRADMAGGSYNDNRPLFPCPITGYPCEGDLSYLCEDYGCARKGGLSPRSEENL